MSKNTEAVRGRGSFAALIMMTLVSRPRVRSR
jgi:hypothetical protein